MHEFDPRVSPDCPGNGFGSLRSELGRAELKFVIRPEIVPSLRSFLVPHMVLDGHSRVFGNRQYPVSTLYFDTPDLRFFNSTVSGERNRVKLRVRRYARPGYPDGDGPVFLEIKRRNNGVVRKWRVETTKDTADGLIGKGAELLPVGHGNGSARARAILDEFFLLGTRYGVRPVINVYYDREAYHCRSRNYLRVTFDRKLASSWTTSRSTRLRPAIRPVDVPGVILEIKYSRSHPSWVTEMIRRFNLSRRSVPKYVMCVQSHDGASHPQVHTRWRASWQVTP